MAEGTNDRYRRLAERFTALLDTLGTDQWAAQTPNAGWTVRDVADHVADTERELLAAMAFPSALPGPGDTSWPVVRDHLQRALEDPSCANHTYDGFFGPTTFAATVETFYVLDLVVHTWDIARATGLSAWEPIDPDDIARCWEAMLPLGDAVRSPGVFGPPVVVSEDAPLQDRFLAWTGRQP